MAAEDDGYLSNSSSSFPTSPHRSRESRTQSTDEYTAQEHELVESIHELQRKLSMMQKPEEDSSPEEVVDKKYRLIMVSNRLPVSIKKNESTGEYEFALSSGGLVTALAGIRNDVPFIWIGWLGVEIPFAEQAQVRETKEADGRRW